jgi:hypothetical protein
MAQAVKIVPQGTPPTCNKSILECPLHRQSGVVGACDGKPAGCQVSVKIYPAPAAYRNNKRW